MTGLVTQTNSLVNKWNLADYYVLDTTPGWFSSLNFATSRKKDRRIIWKSGK